MKTLGCVFLVKHRLRKKSVHKFKESHALFANIEQVHVFCIFLTKENKKLIIINIGLYLGLFRRATFSGMLPLLFCRQLLSGALVLQRILELDC